jgi:hypothetical protein
MSFKHHPSKSSIFSVLNGSAGVFERRRVRAHIASCLRCRIVIEHYGPMLRELSVGRVAESPSRSKHLGVLRVSAAAAAIAIFVLIFAWPRHIQTVRASEILSRAEAAQSGYEDDGSHFYRLHMGATTCSTQDALWVQAVARNGNTCAQLRDQLSKANWDDRHLVSAHSYRRWHDSLTRRRDFVEHEEPYWTIRTDTDQGVLRSASLRVRTSDYRPVELTLEFTALNPVSVVEYRPSVQTASTHITNMDNTTHPEQLQHVDDPADATEVQAWNLLRELGADSGWEAIITRNGSKVQVVGFVPEGEQRTKLTDAFTNIQGVSVNLNDPSALPQRSGDASAPPLAESAIEAVIPDAHERGQRISSIADASRIVVGKAFIYNHLLARRRTLQQGSQAAALNSLIQEEKADLLDATAKLIVLLEPLLPIPEEHGPDAPLSYSQARALDTAILSLYNGASPKSASLEQTTHLVRSLLAKN